jgi:hypothetical protein
MPRGGRQRADEMLLTALACGATVEAAAQKAGVSRSTANRRLNNPEFRHKLQQTRSDLLRRTCDILSAASLEATKTLVGLLGTGVPPSVQLGAARAILELGTRLRETVDLEQRLAALERLHAEGSDARCANSAGRSSRAP